MSFGVDAPLARSWKREFSEQRVNPEALNSVEGLSALRAGPAAAFAIGAKPKRRKAERIIEKRRRISSNPYLTCLN
jgi:hypothetical protein